MLEKLKQAAILTFLLNLLMSLSSPSVHYTIPVSKEGQTPTLTFNPQSAFTNRQPPKISKPQNFSR